MKNLKKTIPVYIISHGKISCFMRVVRNNNAFRCLFDQILYLPIVPFHPMSQSLKILI